jgi:hypothetical protein
MITLPDPSTDFIGFQRALGEAVIMLLREREAERIGPTEAARRLGYGRGYISPTATPWRVPDFGARGTMLPLEEWRSWNETPEAPRRAKWDAMSLKERRELLGIAS